MTNTVANIVTITFPASPAQGDELTIMDARSNGFNSNNLTIKEMDQINGGGTSNLVLSKWSS